MDLTPLVQKMSRRDVVSSTEAEHLDRLLSPVRRVAARTELVRQGQMPGHSTLLLSGFCGRVTTLADGARQITQLSLAGDFLDLHSFLLAVMDHSVVALTEVTYCTLAHDDLRRLTESEPHLTRLLWLETVVDAAIHRQWIVSKGRRSGQAQLAHVFCELYTRLEAAGLALDHRFDLPLTQIDLADVMGMSSVHTNRLLQGMRQAGLIQWTGSEVVLRNWDAMTDMAEFDPTYLRLERAPV